MPKMKSDEAMVLLECLHKPFSASSSQASPHHAFDTFLTYVVRESSHTLKMAQGWIEPGLFVSFDDIKKAHNNNIAVIYKMDCGTILSIILPRTTTIPDYLTTYSLRHIFRGEVGCKIDLKHWQIIGHMSDFVLRKGKKPHLVRCRLRPEKV